MNRSVLLQIKNKVKLVDDGTEIALGRKAPPPIKINGEETDKLSLEQICLSQVVHKVLSNAKESNLSEVSAQFANVPYDVKIKILQYMAVRRELGVFSTLAALSNFHFTVFIAPRNHKLTDDWAMRVSQLCAHLEALDLRGCAGLSLAGVRAIVRVCGRSLVHLDISGIKPFTCPDLFSILECTPNLKFLGVRDTDEDMSALTCLPSLCPHIQQLELSYNRGFSLDLIDAFIHQLKDLTSLDLSWCSGVYDECVIAIAKKLGPRLVALNLELCCRNGGQVTDTAILELAENCPNLERLMVNALKFVTDTSICAIAEKCSNLKDLHVSGCEVTDVGLTAIATHCKELEQLSIVGLPEISDDGVLKIFEKCTKLKLIDVANCVSITPAIRQSFGDKLFHTHPETNANYIPFRVGKQGIIM